MSVTLGEQYTDSITGFTGMAVSRDEHFERRTRVALKPKHGKDHKSKTKWFDECSLIAVADRIEAKDAYIKTLEAVRDAAERYRVHRAQTEAILGVELDEIIDAAKEPTK